jgi:Ca-activated chloride channel family protein
MTDSLQFAHPWALCLLALLPLIAWWKARHGRPIAIRMPSTDDAIHVGARSRYRAGGILLSLSILALTLLIIALARPRLVKGYTEAESSGIDILLTLDVSGSMQAMDFTLNGKQSNRLDAVKDVVGKFALARPDDNLGMVAFAGRAYLAAPLTHDENWIVTRLKDVNIGQVEDGTVIGSALTSAVDHLETSKAKSKIVILLTDGVNTSGSITPLTAAEAAKALGIKIYTIGAGTNGEAPFPVQGFFGTQMVMQKVEIDDKTLTEIADSTGGKYFRATDTDSLEKIYAEINQLETTERKIKKYENYTEIFYYFLYPAIALYLLEWLLRHTRFRRLP